MKKTRTVSRAAIGAAFRTAKPLELRSLGIWDAYPSAASNETTQNRPMTRGSYTCS
jgi:hypothetical protein